MCLWWQTLIKTQKLWARLASFCSTAHFCNLNEGGGALGIDSDIKRGNCLRHKAKINMWLASSRSGSFWNYIVYQAVYEIHVYMHIWPLRKLLFCQTNLFLNSELDWINWYVKRTEQKMIKLHIKHMRSDHTARRGTYEPHILVGVKIFQHVLMQHLQNMWAAFNQSYQFNSILYGRHSCFSCLYLEFQLWSHFDHKSGNSTHMNILMAKIEI